MWNKKLSKNVNGTYAENRCDYNCDGHVQFTLVFFWPKIDGHGFRIKKKKVLAKTNHMF